MTSEKTGKRQKEEETKTVHLVLPFDAVIMTKCDVINKLKKEVQKACSLDSSAAMLPCMLMLIPPWGRLMSSPLPALRGQPAPVALAPSAATVPL